jgi:hypothetical protein
MRDASHGVLDDRTFVEVFRDTVRHRADHFHAVFEGLLMGVRTFEGRQERVVDVDNLIILPDIFLQTASERTCM